MASPISQTLRLGVKSLLLHKLRSGLAVLGILIGVTAVIWLVAMGEGVSYQAQQQIKELGATNIIIRTVKPPDESSSSRSLGSIPEYGLRRTDFARIVANVPTLTQAVPLREIRKEARYNDRSVDIRLVGCTPEYLKMNGLRVASGRFLSDHDRASADNVAVIADETARRLFPYEDPIGRAILIDREIYTVVGRTANRQSAGAIGGSFTSQNYNLDVYIPLETLRQRIGDTVMTFSSGSREAETVQLTQITVTVDEIDNVDQTADLIRLLLERTHSIPDFELTVPKELLQQAETMQMMFNVLLVLIAGIALLVGGIGIMNIMLATVTERTREIGVRRALGAKQSDIIEQFLSETVVLSATGGLLGVLLGFLCGPAVAAFRGAFGLLAPDMLNSLPPNIQELEPRLAPWSIVAAFCISVIVGIVFGLYPARRAAQMDPIEALRHE